MSTYIGLGQKVLDTDKLRYYAETRREIIERKERTSEEPVAQQPRRYSQTLTLNNRVNEVFSDFFIFIFVLDGMFHL